MEVVVLTVVMLMVMEIVIMVLTVVVIVVVVLMLVMVMAMVVEITVLTMLRMNAVKMTGGDDDFLCPVASVLSPSAQPLPYEFAVTNRS